MVGVTLTSWWSSHNYFSVLLRGEGREEEERHRDPAGRDRAFVIKCDSHVTQKHVLIRSKRQRYYKDISCLPTRNWLRSQSFFLSKESLKYSDCSRQGS